jgi:hypothetical protein
MGKLARPDICIRHCDSDVTDRSRYVLTERIMRHCLEKSPEERFQVGTRCDLRAKQLVVRFGTQLASADGWGITGAPPGVCVGSVGLHGGRATYAFGRLCDRVCAVDQRQLGKEQQRLATAGFRQSFDQ